MSLEKEVKGIIRDKEEAYKKNDSYRGQISRYQEMVRRGLVKKQVYELPPTDTIGTRRYQAEDEK